MAATTPGVVGRAVTSTGGGIGVDRNGGGVATGYFSDPDMETNFRKDTDWFSTYISHLRFVPPPPPPPLIGEDRSLTTIPLQEVTTVFDDRHFQEKSVFNVFLQLLTGFYLLRYFFQKLILVLSLLGCLCFKQFDLTKESV